VVNGQAEADFTFAAKGIGAHPILAVYSGDSTFSESGASQEEYVAN
jgi:hypothetical protein